MPKMKTHKGAQKRFKATASGKLKRACQGKRHILTKKSRERKRKLRQGSYVDGAQDKAMRTLIQGGGQPRRKVVITKEEVSS